MKAREWGVLQSEPSEGSDRHTQSGSFDEINTSSSSVSWTEHECSLRSRHTEPHSKRESAKLKSIFINLVLEGALIEKKAPDLLTSSTFYPSGTHIKPILSVSEQGRGLKLSKLTSLIKRSGVCGPTGLLLGSTADLNPQVEWNECPLWGKWW